MRGLLVLLVVPLLGCASPLRVLPPTPHENQIVVRARLEVTRHVAYDANYRNIPYPNGDVRPTRGACADVVVRAYRAAGVDLQKLIFEDRKANPGAYGGGTPDPCIDHRRCQNQIVYFRRHAESLTTDPSRIAAWRPGDVVYWRLYSGRLHTGIVSDRTGMGSRPLVIHNIGPEASEGDVLAMWEVVAHFRL